MYLPLMNMSVRILELNLHGAWSACGPVLSLSLSLGNADKCWHEAIPKVRYFNISMLRGHGVVLRCSIVVVDEKLTEIFKLTVLFVKLVK